MATQGGRKLEFVPGYSVFLDGTIPESYGGSGSTWTNLSGNGNNCGLVNGPTYLITPAGAGFLNFNGSSQYGSIGELGLGGNFTLIAWVKKNNSSSEGYFIGAGWQSAINAVNFGVTGLTPTLNSGWGWGNRKEVAAGVIDTSRWHHLCAVKSSGVGYVYVNGLLQGSGVFNPGYDNFGAAATSFIGRSAYESPDFHGDPGDYRYFGGSLGMVLIYNGVVLSSGQVLDNYNQTKGRFGR